MLKKYKPKFSISIVSHGHRKFVISLLQDLKNLNRNDLEIILTWNLPKEESNLDIETLPFPLNIINNITPKGFAANHNFAFKKSTGSNFVILNPDISIPDDPFPYLISILENHSPCVCAPLIKNQNGEIEDSARSFPTPLTLIKKAIAKLLKHKLAIEEISTTQTMLNPDWIAGMFMVIPNSIYKNLGGLSERYFMYYEDVDFCARARQEGIEIFVSKLVAVVHYAQRTSHENFQFFKWHIRSALKFMSSKTYILLMLKKIMKKVN